VVKITQGQGHAQAHGPLSGPYTLAFVNISMAYLIGHLSCLAFVLSFGFFI